MAIKLQSRNSALFGTWSFRTSACCCQARLFQDFNPSTRSRNVLAFPVLSISILTWNLTTSKTTFEILEQSAQCRNMTCSMPFCASYQVPYSEKIRRRSRRRPLSLQNCCLIFKAQTGSILILRAYKFNPVCFDFHRRKPNHLRCGSMYLGLASVRMFNHDSCRIFHVSLGFALHPGTYDSEQHNS